MITPKSPLLGRARPDTSQPGTNPELEADLTATLGAFETRIQRKKKEQRQQTTIVQQESKVRHSLILEALMNIRRALTDVVRIDLGERFSFSFDIDDWQGWPRLGIRLYDSLLPNAEYPNFLVQANDRQGRGILEITHSNPEKPERISITAESDLAILPAVLKKCVRSYLDLIAEIVLDSETKTHEDLEKEAQLLRKKNIKEFEEHAVPPSLTGDLYEDGMFETAILEALPNLQELEALPDVLSGQERKSENEKNVGSYFSTGCLGSK